MEFHPADRVRRLRERLTPHAHREPRTLTAAEAGVARAQAGTAGWRSAVRLPRTFSALRHRNYRLYWFGQLVSLIGTWMQSVAQGWLVYELTSSPLALGIVGFATSVPVLLFTLPAGVLVDRIERRKLIMLTQGLAAIQALLLAGLTFTGRVEVWHLILLAFGLGTVNAVDVPARQAFLLEMVPREDLMNAIALNSSVFNAARVVGPALAGLVLAALGPALCFFVNGLSFLATITSLSFMRLVPRRRSQASKSPWLEFKEGLRYVSGQPVVRVLMVIVGVSSAFGLGYVALMPVFAESILRVGAGGYGLLMAAIGVGAFTGAVGIASLGDFQSKGKLLTISSISFPIALLAFTGTRSFPLALLFLAFAGTMLMVQGTMANTILQTIVPDELRGRVMSFYTLMFIGMTPMSNLQSGIVADLFGAPSAVAAGALVCLGVATYIALRQPYLLGYISSAEGQRA